LIDLERRKLKLINEVTAATTESFIIKIKQIDDLIAAEHKKMDIEDKADKKSVTTTLANTKKANDQKILDDKKTLKEKEAIKDREQINDGQRDARNRQAEADSMQTKIVNTEALTNQLSTTFSGYYDYLNTATTNRMNKDIQSENVSYENKKAYIIANVFDETARTKQLNALEQGHNAAIENIKNKADADERKRRNQMKPVMIAEAIANTALGATKAFSQGGFFGFAMAALVIAAGMAQVATIAAQKFAQGGMVMGQTIAMMGEAGSEVALPLTHPNTIMALSGALQQAMAYEGAGTGGRNIYVTVPPISTRAEARRMGDIIGDAILNKVNKNIIK
jgi:hypothetical protein